MARKYKQCPRCGLSSQRGTKVCSHCQNHFERWRMNTERIRLCHVLAKRKGLDDEVYRWRLNALGVESCKDLKKSQFFEFVKGLNSLPDLKAG